MINLSSIPKRPQQFGHRKDVHRIIFAKGDQVTSVNIHPFIALGGVFIVIIFVVAYLGATGYLMFRDDLLNTAHIRQVKIQNAYEDQLATLRIEIDRIASRQLLDQKSVENKIDRLLGLRASLDERQRTVTHLAQTASAAGITIPASAPNPRPHPKRIDSPAREHASAGFNTALTTAFAGSRISQAFPFALADREANTDYIKTLDDGIVDLTVIEKKLANEERAQAQQLRLMAEKTADSSRNIANVLHSLGFKAPAAPPHSADAIGGPFEDADNFNPLVFDSSIHALQENLSHLNKLTKTVKLIPLKRPLDDGEVSSAFGPRLDPFLNRYAVHSGIDFKAPFGAPVYATGPGKVIMASWNGGYGRMVEIEHAGNIITRYAHLSRINVAEGEQISTGTVIGFVGSTGRSTGPHLHYETRLGEKPLNPERFFKAGIRISSLL